ncbi:Transcription repressor OFP14 [Striga hermonthica]|uniref:Transcription repressor OFP14 n=1 Tax=Striga hermonthica TaxID=68872 RepID=A0A9N7N455_STRHE|nr:Transcription repressor OFP14 [Striga hermonthica]
MPPPEIGVKDVQFKAITQSLDDVGKKSKGENHKPDSDGKDMREMISDKAQRDIHQPVGNFQRSMAEVVEVRLNGSEKVDWDFLEELLFRYLDMNNEKTHRNVLRAFADLVVVFHENDWRSPERQRRPWEGVGGGGRRLLKGEK